MRYSWFPSHDLCAMVEYIEETGLVFKDLFNETSDTALDSHTPNIGDSWTNTQTTGTPTVSHVEVRASSDDIAANVSDTSAGRVYSADVTMNTADYQVVFDIPTAASSDENLTIGLRMDGTGDNGYTIEGFRDSNHDDYIHRVTSGSFVQLDTHDHTDWISWADGDTDIVCQIAGSEISAIDSTGTSIVFDRDWETKLPDETQ